jgi:mRNA-degrading endonuclease toxin of MazEF toxin-antitoxin module
MALGDAFGKEFLVVGAVVLSHRFKFPEGTQPKFCALLEDFDGGRETTIVALTTTNFRYRNKPWVILIPAGEDGLEKDCLLDCNNCFEIPTINLISSGGFAYKGKLSDELIEEIFEALEWAHKLPDHFALRIFGF